MNNVDIYVQKAFKFMLDNDADLSSAHEISYAHRLAIYLEQNLKQDNKYSMYIVDIEYDRNAKDEKRLNYERDNIEDEYKIRPDIIAHKRNQKDNLLIIELKKEESSTNDKEKIKQLCKNENYQYANGYCISINKKIIEKYSKKEEKWIVIHGGKDE